MADKGILVSRISYAFRAEVSHLAKEGFISAESLSNYFDATSAPDFYFSSPPPDKKIDVFDYIARHRNGESSPYRFFLSARWFSEQKLLEGKTVNEPRVENNPRWFVLTNDFQSVPIKDLPVQIQSIARAVLELWRQGNHVADWRNIPADFLTPRIVEEVIGARGNNVVTQENFRLFIPSCYAISFKDLAAFVTFLRDIKGFKNLPDVDERDLPTEIISARLVGTHDLSLSSSLFDDARRTGKNSPEAKTEKELLEKCPNLSPLLSEINWLLKYYTPRLQDSTRTLLDQRDPTAWAKLLVESAARVFVPADQCDVAELQVENLKLVVGSEKNETIGGVGWITEDGMGVGHLFIDKTNIGDPKHALTVVGKKDDHPPERAQCEAGSVSGFIRSTNDFFRSSSKIPLTSTCQPNPETVEALRHGLESPHEMSFDPFGLFNILH